MDGALGLRFVKPLAVENPLGGRDIPEMRDGMTQHLREMLGSILACLAARSIGTIDQRMLGVRLHHHERHRRPKIHVLKRAVAEIALDEPARLAKEGRSLIEKPARATGKSMFRLLADLRERHLVLFDAIDLRERKDGGHLKGRAGAETGTQGDIAAKHSLEALARLCGLAVEKPIERAKRIICPGRSRLDLLHVRQPARVRFAVCANVARHERDRVVIAWRNGKKRSLVDRRRKHKPLVVVRMVAKHLDAARRVRHRSRLPAKELLKLGDDLVIDILVQHFSFLLCNVSS